jgi:N-acetylglucosaminyldiphosphoundecaprenol N-acetyl-beta-D-mannosaminyltransferase
MALAVFDLVNARRLRLGLVATTSSNLAAAVSVMRQHGVHPTYARNGFFSSDEEIMESCRTLIDQKIDVVIVGMGAPYQEAFMLRLKQSGWKGVAFSCGGYIEQVAKAKSLVYYPEWANRSVIRAIYRVSDDPLRLLRRYVVDYSVFYRAALGVPGAKLRTKVPAPMKR